jgi:hypothetical protein
MLDESYRFAVDAISKDATVPHDADGGIGRATSDSEVY